MHHVTWLAVAFGLGALCGVVSCLVLHGGTRENAFLRQQLIVAKRRNPAPKPRRWDRMVLAALTFVVGRWRELLVIVSPGTILAWRRNLLKLWWRRKSSPAGRPSARGEIKKLVLQMATENPLWGAPRIHAEIQKLGLSVAQSTVSRHMPKRPKHPSPNWRNFLRDHFRTTAAMDIFTVHTAAFRPLKVLFILSLNRRKILHFAVSSRPSAAWVAQQYRNAFPFNAAPPVIIRDRDPVFAAEAGLALEAMQVREVKTTPRSPWQNGYAERWIGSVRRECLDHKLIMDERHLLRVLTEYVDYYHEHRTHLGLDKDTPNRRAIHLPFLGNIITLPQVGGLHHVYLRRLPG